MVDKRPTSAAVVDVSALSEAQRRAADRIIEISHSAGVLVGAIPAGQLWDVRPLMLEGGRIHIIRGTDPALKLNRHHYDRTREIFSKVGARERGESFLRWGEAAGQLWVKRAFFPFLLSDAPRSLRIHDSGFINRLVSRVAAFGREGIYHGHLCAANIGLTEDAEPHLIDFGFFFAAQTDAAELREESYLSDLSMLLRTHFWEDLSEEQQALIRQIDSRDSRNSISLEDLSSFFKTPSRGVSERTPAGKVMKGSSKPTAPTPAPTQKSYKQKYPVGKTAQSLPDFAAWWESASTFLKKYPLRSAGVGAAIGVGVFFAFYRHQPHIPDFPVAEYWGSGRQNLMEQTAEDAVDFSDSPARKVILDSVFDQKNPPKFIKTGLLRLAFNERWADDLSRDDRDAAFDLALVPLVPSALEKLPSLNDLHPGVLLAAVGDIAPEQELGAFGKVSANSLATLPGPIGEVFSRLIGKREVTLGDPSVRLLARAISDGFSERSVQMLMSSPNAAAHLSALVPLFKTEKALGERTFASLAEADGTMGDSLRWFSLEEAAGWSKVPPFVMLLTAAGEPPYGVLSAEQQADLLSFPSPQVRATTAIALSEKALPAESKLVPVALIQSGAGLSRFQIITLIAGLRLTGESRYAFLATWFKTNPPPAVVLAVLLARRGATGIDPFNVEAARYLQDKELTIDSGTIAMLSQHPEPLARALAYGKLDPANPKDREILQKALERESVPRLKKELESRVGRNAGFLLRSNETPS